MEHNASSKYSMFLYCIIFNFILGIFQAETKTAKINKKEKASYQRQVKE